MVVAVDEPPKEIVEVVADKVVAIENMNQAEVNYSTRIGVLTSDQLADINWDKEVRFKCNDSDSRSFEVSDLFQEDDTMDLDWLFRIPQSCGAPEPGEDNDNLDLEWLFTVPNVRENLSDGFNFWEENDYGLQLLFAIYYDHFGEDEINQAVLDDLIKRKRKNSLYELFLKENKLPTPGPKRKHSPGEVLSSKMRRMTLATDSSPSLRRTKVAIRRRADSSGSYKARRNYKESQALDPQQQLLSTMWGKNKLNL